MQVKFQQNLKQSFSNKAKKSIILDTKPVGKSKQIVYTVKP